MAINEIENQTLEEIIISFRMLGASEDRMERSKEAEALKSAFYKRLSMLKAQDEAALESAPGKYDEVEQQFKAVYADYKKERAEYVKTQDAERTDNLKVKTALIDELKTLVESPLDDVSSAFPKLREIQQKWRETGPVPASDYRVINDTYQFLVERFYDMVQINHDLRDLDFKKNLEAKTALCEQAEALVGEENVVDAFASLQKLHEAWKDLGPVAKDVREEIWNRFKEATAAINKSYQSHFESLKEQYAANLEAKKALCEKVEEIVARENINEPGLWNSLSKEIEQIQAEWKQIGYASRKDNQKIYERLRAACDTFYARKKEFFSAAKDSLEENIAKKEALIAEAAKLKISTEWKQATDQFISLQKQWKEVGSIPRKKAEQLWKRFRAECDYFFEQRDKNAKPQNDFYANLKAKKALIAEIEAWAPKDGEDEAQTAHEFEQRYAAIGHVPFKEKDNIVKAYRDAMQSKFTIKHQRKAALASKPARDPHAELVKKYHAMEQEIATLENNLGFFASSKNAAPLIEQMQAKIDAAKADLAALKEQIRNEEING